MPIRMRPPARDSFSATKRLPAEGTYSLNLSLAETARMVRTRPLIQPTLLGVLDESPSLGSKRRIEDYEALVAPYRPLLADLSSMEVLDELLRILYEEGDVPSVVGWRGKTSDGEYMNLREYKHFCEILQGISLYDHTYNVLKAALDIAGDDLRQRHDFLLPSVITAALAHDIGKTPSLWQSSTIKKHDHESIGEARLEEMLASMAMRPSKKASLRPSSCTTSAPKKTLLPGSLRTPTPAQGNTRSHQPTQPLPSNLWPMAGSDQIRRNHPASRQ